MMDKYRISRKEKKHLIRIIISLIFFLIIFISDKIADISSLTSLGWVLPFALYLTLYIAIGYDVLIKAGRNIIALNPLDENFLMCVATIGAFTLAIVRGINGEYAEGFDEACAVLLFYQTGEFFQRYATGRSRSSISALMDIRPDYANVIRDETVENVYPDDVVIGEIIIVAPGERIPLDGVIVRGSSSLDTMALTGESTPRDVECGDEVLSGCVNLSSSIEIRVTKEFYDSTATRVLELVESASDKKSRAESFITRFARYYTPIVVAAALLLTLIPGIITGKWSVWIYRALSFLVVSCPCALVISIPMTFFVGIGTASSHHILVKGSDYLERLETADIFVFDKTGTITKGEFKVTKIEPESDREDILYYAALAESASSHPIARSIVRAWGKSINVPYEIENISGYGIASNIGNETILCGSYELMRLRGIDVDRVDETGTVVYVAKNTRPLGWILVEDEVKEEADKVIAMLEKDGAKTVILTGDREDVAKKVAQSVGISEYRASLLPQDKVYEVERLMKTDRKNALCFIGDGINDAPVLMRADIGISMGGIGSDAAIESADIVLMNDDLRALPIARKIAKKTMNIVRENLVFSLGIKIAILILSAVGITNMWIAVFGDVGVAVIAILNAMRVSRVKKPL